VSEIATWAGRQVLRSLTDRTLTALGDAPGPARVLCEVFAVAVRRCLLDHDPRAVTAYVRELLARHDVPSDGPVAREAEALVRAALGRPAWTGDIDGRRAMSLMILMVGDLAGATVAALPGENPPDEAALLTALIEEAEHRIARLDPAGRR
jgi:hypothetical protein